MKRVLIVDDSPSVLRLLQFVLESEKYEVVTADDGAAGLEKVREQPPDLIVTDSIMPGIDGFALMRTLKEAEPTRDIPIIMLTSENPAQSDLARVPKPEAFIQKSADFLPLLNKVRELLGKTP
jgi:twitching motility two-component system response regulator PilH